MEALPSAPAQRRYRMPEVVKSAVRALEILEFFDRCQGPVSVGEIAADLGYPQSSTSALLRSMVKVGYLAYDAHKRTFMPTRRVALLGGWLGEPFLREGPVLDGARRLMERAGLAVGIGRRNGCDVQWLHAVPGGDMTPAEIFSTRASLTRSAAGLSLLASLDIREAQGLIHRVNAEAQSLSLVVPPAELTAQIAQIRRDGYALAEDEGTTMLAKLAPIAVTEEPVALVLLDTGGGLAAARAEMAAIMDEVVAGMQPRRPAEMIPFRKPAEPLVHASPAWGWDRVAAHG